jgi:hypothetical protein
MNNRDFNKMCGLMLLSVALLALTTFALDWPPILTLPLAIAPLCAYHVKVLLPRVKDGLSQAAIDSVYYFGFLVTVAALSVSALLVGFRGAAQSMDVVVLHFGTGLFATAYAVVARMHLQSRAAEATEVTIEQVMDTYVAKSSELVKNVETASVQLAAFSREIVARTIEAAELTRLAANEKMLNVAEEFSAQMSETLENARQGVHDFRVVMNSTAFSAERKEYTESMKDTVAATGSLNKVLVELITKRREEVNVSQLNITATTNLALHLRQFASQVETFAGPDGAMAQSVAALHGVTDEVTQATHAIAGTVSGMEQVVANVDDGSAALKTIRTLSKRAADQLDMLTTSSQRAGEAAVHIGDLADSAEVLVQHVKSLDTVIDALSGATGKLAANFGKAEVASSIFDNELAKLPDQIKAVEAFSTRVGTSLETIAAHAEQTLGSSAVLAGHSESARKALEGAGKLVDHASTLESSVTSLHKALGDLAVSVADAQHTMVDAAANVKNRLAEPAIGRDEEIALKGHTPDTRISLRKAPTGVVESLPVIDQLAETEAKS